MVDNVESSWRNILDLHFDLDYNNCLYGVTSTPVFFGVIFIFYLLKKNFNLLIKIVMVNTYRLNEF